MAAIEKLLAMGLPHSPDPARLLLGGGDTSPASERLTWQDVRHALGHLRPEQRAIVQLKAVPELVTGSELAAFVHVLASRLLQYQRRHGGRRALEAQAAHDPAARATLRTVQRRDAAILRVALAEYMDPRTCIRCRGTGWVLDYLPSRGMVRGTCGRCEGQGWVPWSDNRRARAVGGTREHWTHRYAPAYEHVLRVCTQEYRAAVAALKAALFGESDQNPDAIERRLQARV